MNSEQFIKAYQSLSELKDLKLSLPAVKEENFSDAVLRLGIRGALPSLNSFAQWDDIIDYQRYQLKLYLRNSWREMLKVSKENTTLFFFLNCSPELLTFMGREFIFMADMVQGEDENADLQLELLLCSKEAEKLLCSYFFDIQVQQSLTSLMIKKLHCLVEKAYHSAHSHFIGQCFCACERYYPVVCGAIASELQKIKTQPGFETKECKELIDDLYALYVKE